MTDEQRERLTAAWREYFRSWYTYGSAPRDEFINRRADVVDAILDEIQGVRDGRPPSPEEEKDREAIIWALIDEIQGKPPKETT